jgi:integration host factor subunit alpha
MYSYTRPFEKRRTTMSMTKIDIAESICEQLGILKKESLHLVESVIDIIKEELGKGHDVMISGFGKWTVKSKKARKGRNPQTGKAMIIDARKVVTFKPSYVLSEEIK